MFHRLTEQSLLAVNKWLGLSSWKATALMDTPFLYVQAWNETPLARSYSRISPKFEPEAKMFPHGS